MGPRSSRTWSLRRSEAPRADGPLLAIEAPILVLDQVEALRQRAALRAEDERVIVRQIEGGATMHVVREETVVVPLGLVPSLVGDGVHGKPPSDARFWRPPRRSATRAGVVSPHPRG